MTLVIQNWRERGPRVTITFESGEGLEVGKTLIKYRDVTIGRVSQITLSDDRTHVEVVGDLVKSASDMAVQGAQFWVVRPRIGVGWASGLDTLLSGAYIGVEPGTGGGSRMHFVGLETPPPLDHGSRGRQIVLTAHDLGSLSAGAPVYFHRFQVGRVIEEHLDESTGEARIVVFIDAPYDKDITPATRFWNASGVDLNLSAEGLKVRTQSAATVLAGRIDLLWHPQANALSVLLTNERSRTTATLQNSLGALVPVSEVQKMVLGELWQISGEIRKDRLLLIEQQREGLPPILLGLLVFWLTLLFVSFGLRLEDVRREDVEQWRDGLRRGRLPRSVNRQVRAVVAALNFAVSKRGHLGTREAWELEHLVDDAEENVAVFLTADQRANLIAHSSRPLAALLAGYAHTGARPSELGEATVADFDATAGTITLRHRKGRGAKLRSRAVMLSDEGITFFRAQARGKLPKAPLISGADGGHWRAGDCRWRSGPPRKRLMRRPEKQRNASPHAYLRIHFVTHESASSCKSMGSIRLRWHSSAARAC
jgi:integrase